MNPEVSERETGRFQMIVLLTMHDFLSMLQSGRASSSYKDRSLKHDEAPGSLDWLSLYELVQPRGVIQGNEVVILGVPR